MVTNQQTAVASRIDQFLSEVSERERELEEERQQRMESRKRPDWNRSISYQSSFKSQLSSRKLSSSQSPSLSRDLSNRSSQVSRDRNSWRSNTSLATCNRPRTAPVKPILRLRSSKLRVKTNVYCTSVWP